MKKVYLVLTSIAFLAISAPVFAVSDNGNGNANAQSEPSVNSSSNATTGNNTSSTQNQTQTQTQTSNAGVGTALQTQAEVQLQDRIQESKPEYSPKNEQAQARMSQVAKAVENLTRVAERVENQGIGTQIRTIAQTQSENCDLINKAIDQAQTRSAFAYFFAGANYSELKNVQTLMEQNRVQIQELEKLMAQVTVEADKLEIANQIIVLQNQQTQLQDQLQVLTSRFSLFGWLNRWIHGVTI